MYGHVGKAQLVEHVLILTCYCIKEDLELNFTEHQRKQSTSSKTCDTTMSILGSAPSLFTHRAIATTALDSIPRTIEENVLVLGHTTGLARCIELHS